MMARIKCFFFGHDWPDLHDLGDDPELAKWQGFKEDKCRRCSKIRKVHFW